MADPARCGAGRHADIDEMYRVAAYDVFQWLAHVDDSDHCLVTFHC